MNKEKVVIIGYGWVGQANALALSMMGHKAYFYDISEASARHYGERYGAHYNDVTRLGSPTEVDASDTVYLVCVGDRVSNDGVQDISGIQAALNSIADVEGVVILRSTVQPDNLKGLKFDFYIPEFLHEKKGVEECLEPYFFVVGTEGNKNEPTFFNEWRKRSYKSIVCSPDEASHIKYLSNIWNAQRIAFVNEFGRIIQLSNSGSLGDDKSLAKVATVLTFLFGDKPYYKYGRAYTGHCLPKDMRAYTAFGKKYLNPAFLDGVMGSNAEHEKFHNSLNEWFSPWRRSEISGREALKALFRAVKRRLVGRKTT